MHSIGETLKRLRGKRSLREMEKITGISHTYLSSLEKGVDPRTGKERKPSPETLHKIASALGVDYLGLIEEAGYLFEAYDEKSKSALLAIYKKTSENIKAIKNELLNNGDYPTEIKMLLSETIEEFHLPVTADSFISVMEKLNEEFAVQINKAVDYGDDFYFEHRGYFNALERLSAFTQEGRERITAFIERSKQSGPELLLILQEDGLTYNGRILTKEERQHILDMLAWSFRNKK
ncbi:helix-turn-helix domain-containing protein [Brevibacillus panacihumi]|uniref:helix-turn-helix domain-containing protein n=1 Tax=Brevibacillus panacihumi TaxID=497735 RepID=UPI003CFF8322